MKAKCVERTVSKHTSIQSMRDGAETYKAMPTLTWALEHLLRCADTKVQVLFRHVFLSCSVKEKKTLKEHERSNPRKDSVFSRDINCSYYFCLLYNQHATIYNQKRLQNF